MTREHRLILSLDEIRAVRWTCTHCQTAISYPLEHPIRFPDFCPACHGTVPKEAAAIQAEQTLRECAAALKAAAAVARAKQGPPVTISLEFSDPPLA